MVVHMTMILISDTNTLLSPLPPPPLLFLLSVRTGAWNFGSAERRLEGFLNCPAELAVSSIVHLIVTAPAPPAAWRKREPGHEEELGRSRLEESL